MVTSSSSSIPNSSCRAVPASRFAINSSRSAPRPEVVPDAAHDQDLDVVVDAGLEQQVGVTAPGRNGRDVELVGTVERDRGDPRGRILLVEDDLLGRWDIGGAHVVRLLVGGMGVVARDSGPASVTTTGSWT